MSCIKSLLEIKISLSKYIAYYENKHNELSLELEYYENKKQEIATKLDSIESKLKEITENNSKANTQNRAINRVGSSQTNTIRPQVNELKTVTKTKTKKPIKDVKAINDAIAEDFDQKAELNKIKQTINITVVRYKERDYRVNIKF
jgi:hypothetical protein